MKSIAEVKDVTYWYPESEKPALRDFSLKVARGEFLLVVGSSGSGKSTFCRLLNGLVPNFSGGKFMGRVAVCGLDTREAKTADIARKIGLVFQDPENQFITEGVEAEVAFGLENLNLSRAVMKSRVNDALSSVGVTHLKARKLSTLSGGEKQRAILAAVLAMQPELLVLDEPTSQLDPKGAREFLDALSAAREKLGLTVVLAEHRTERVLPYVSRALDLDSGRAGAPEKILAKARYVPPQLALKKINYKNLKLRRREKLKKGKPVITVSGLSACVGSHAALSNINLKFREGEFTALLGLNGSGKTTLLKHFNGLLKSQRGGVTVDGLDAAATPTEILARLVGYVAQNPSDFLHADTVEDELKFTLRNLGVDGDAEATLKLLNLSHLKNSYPRDLSGGERVRVALASVLVADPKVIVLDEPTRGVDHSSKIKLMKFLRGLCAEGKCVIVASHDVDSIDAFADRVVILDGGKVKADGEAHRVLPKSKHFKTTLSQLLPDSGFLTMEELREALK